LISVCLHDSMSIRLWSCKMNTQKYRRILLSFMHTEASPEVTVFALFDDPPWPWGPEGYPLRVVAWMGPPRPWHSVPMGLEVSPKSHAKTPMGVPCPLQSRDPTPMGVPPWQKYCIIFLKGTDKLLSYRNNLPFFIHVSVITMRNLVFPYISLGKIRNWFRMLID
jgi:hypothetical protein